MLDNKIRIWFRAIRPFSFTASLIPVIIGSILGIKESGFEIGYFILTLLGVMVLHSSINLLSDYDDFTNEVDTIDSYGSSGVILENLLKPKEVLVGGLSLLFLGSLIGLFLVIQKGLLILGIGLIGAVGGYFYTGKPLELKYKGLGGPLIFLLFGPLIVIGSYFVQNQMISIDAFLIAIPIGLLTTCIMYANDIRDIPFDKRAGITTLPVLVGKNMAHKIYGALILISYISLIIMVIYKVATPWMLFSLISMPSAFKILKKLSNSYEQLPSYLATIDIETAKLHAQFGTLMIMSIFTSYIIG